MKDGERGPPRRPKFHESELVGPSSDEETQAEAANAASEIRQLRERLEALEATKKADTGQFLFALLRG